MAGTIVTISREYGSGGREVGQKLAQALGVPFYDNELITLAAKKSGYAEGLFEETNQKPAGSLLYTLSMYGAGVAAFDLPLNDKVFLVQSDVIKDVAAQGPCVIVGRCADYVLRDCANTVNVFIYGDPAARVERAVGKLGLPAAKAKDMVAKIDKRRASYYDYYTSQKWGRASNYDICIDSSTLGIDGTVEVIRCFVAQKEAAAAK